MNHRATPASVFAADMASRAAPATILFIDAAVADAQQLIAAAANGTRVFLLDPARDGVEQISGVLQTYKGAGLASIQIVSHGSAGQLALGSGALNGANLASYQAALQHWGAALADGGDLLLYGCDVAAGSDGAAFIEQLALATGADVAASTDATGSAALGANWVLERQSGAIEAGSAIDAAGQQAYGHTLGLLNGGLGGTLNWAGIGVSSILDVAGSLLGIVAGQIVSVVDNLGTGLDIYAKSSHGGGLLITNVGLLGSLLGSAHVRVSGTLGSAPEYVELRANAGIFDLTSLKLGTGDLGGLFSATFTVQALDSNFQLKGTPVTLNSVLLNNFATLSVGSNPDFDNIGGVRITANTGLQIDIDDIVITAPRIAASISAAVYDAGSGILTVAALGLGIGDAIDPTKLTLNGQGGSYTLTTPLATASSAIAFAVTLNAADKMAVNGLLNLNGGLSVGGNAFSLLAANNWDSQAGAAADLNLNLVVVTNLQLPTITSSSYNAATHVLTVNGANMVGTLGLLNDIVVNKLTLTGEGGVSRTLTTSANVELTSLSSFSVTVSGADALALDAMMSKNGTAAAGGTSYALTVADDWNGVIGNVNIGLSNIGVTVSNVANLAPVISGAAAATLNDNGTTLPFAGITVSDGNNDTVSLTIQYAAANGTLSGSGLSGSAGNYSLSAASAALLTSRLDALVFTPTPNQAASGTSVVTTFTLTATDSQGLAGSANTGTVLTTTSVNDAPQIGGAAAGQNALAGALLSVFGDLTVSDVDAGAAVTVTVALDNAFKGNFTGLSLLLSGFSSSDGGLTYTHAATSPAAAQAALHALVFQPTFGVAATTTLTVSINDGSSTTVDNSTTVTATVPSFTIPVSLAFSSDTGLGSNDLITNVAGQTLSGTLSGNLALGETVEVSFDNGLNWSTASGSIGSNNWTLASQTLAGSGFVQVRVSNPLFSSLPLVKGYVLDTLAPVAAAATIAFSHDSGASSTDLVTNISAQTIFGTLSANLALGEWVEVSIDNGASWSVAAALAGTNGWALGGQVLSGNNTVQVRVNDLAGNTSAALSRVYAVDTTSPTLTIGSDASALAVGQTAAITFTFSEAPSSFTAGAVTVANGTLGGFGVTANPLVYSATFTPTAGVAGGMGAISVAAGAYVDLAGNSGAGAAAPAIALNTQAPGLAISSDVGALASGQSAVITFTFSVAPLGFDASDVVASNGTLSGFVASANPLVYTAVFTPTPGLASGSAGVTVAAGLYTDGAGNSGAGASMAAISIDTLAPSTSGAGAVFSVDSGVSASDLVTNVASQTISGTLTANLVAGELVEVSLDNGANWVAAVATPGSAAWSLAGLVLSGSNTLQVRVSDAAGNHGLPLSTAYVFDTQAPTLAITSDLGALNSAQTALLSFTFSEAPSGFTQSDVTVGGGVLSAFAVTADPRVYTAVFTPTLGVASGSATASVAGATYTDAAGNSGAGASMTPIPYATLAPGVAISSNVASLKSGDTALISFTFSSAPSGFTQADVTASGGVLSGFSATANPLVYTAVFTPTPGMASGSAAVTVAAGSYLDGNGNSGAGASMPAVAIDTVVPTLTIGSDVAVLKVGDTANISFTFSEAPVGFTQGDVNVANGTLGTLTATASPLVYTAVFTPTTGLGGASAQISVAAGAYTDAAGNSGAGGTPPALSIQTLVPSTTGGSVAFSNDNGVSAADLVTNVAAQTISGTLSAGLLAGERVEVSLDNGANWVTATSGTGSSAWTLAGQTLSGSNTLQVRVADTAGNHGAAFSSAYVLDTQAPTVAIGSSAASLKAGDTATITFTFSEAPQGFALNDLSVAGGVLGNLAVTANPLVYTALFTPTANNPGSTAVITLNGGLYGDAAGNGGVTGSAPGIAIDTLAPTTSGAGVAFSNDGGVSASDLVTNSTGQTISGTLNANLLAGERVEVSLDNGVNWIAASAASGSAWSLTGQALSNGSNTVQVRVADTAGNHGNAFSAAYTLDTQAPTLAITSNLSTLNSAQTALISFTFSEAPSGFTQGDVTVGGGVLGAFTATANPLVYTAVFTPTAGVASGSATVTVAGASYLDAAGNSGAGAAMAPVSYATVSPGVAISSNLASLKSGDTAVLSFTFSSAPVGFTLADITAGGGTLSGFGASANPLVYTAVFTPTAGLASGSAAVTVAAGSYLDANGNSGAGASMPAVAIDTVAPGLVIGSDVGTLKAGETALISFTFSEAPLGFTQASIGVGNGTLSAFGATANPLVYTAVFTPTVGLSGASAQIAVLTGAYTDAAGNSGAGGTPPALSLNTLAPSTAVGSVVFSSDNGSSGSDLLTNSPNQTISGTLGANLLPGELVEVSLDNGANWIAATSSSGSSAWSLTGQTLLEGAHNLQVRVADSVGNHGAAVLVPYVLDTQAPTVAIGSNAASLKAGDTATITFTFSEAPSGFTLADLHASGGTLSTLAVTASPLVYTALFTPTHGVNSASAAVTLASGLYTDVAGNAGGAGATPAIALDTLPPLATGATVSLSTDSGASGSDLVTNVAAQTISGTLDANLAAGELVQVSLDNGANWITAAATPGSSTWSLAGQTLGGSGTLQVRVADAAGNQGEAFSAAYLLDTQAPTLAITSNLSSLNSAQTALISFAFSEAPSGFTEGDVAVNGGALSAFGVTANPLIYTAVFTPTLGVASGSATITVAGARYTDAAGNNGAGAAMAPVSYATVGPGVAISSDVASLKSGDTALLSFTFSAAPVGFSQADITASGGALSGFTASANPLVYTAQFTPAPGVAGGVAAITVAAGSYLDGNGNSGAGASMPAVAIDTLAPALAISSNAGALKVGETATISFTFSEAPSGFTQGDVSVSNGTLSAFGATANALVYTAVFTPTPGVASGSAVIAVAAGLYGDAAGNGGAASSAASISIDTLAPVSTGAGVVFSSDNGSSASDLLTNSPNQAIAGTLSASLLAGERVEVSLDNGASWVTATSSTGSGNWSLTGQTLSQGVHTLQVRVADTAGNHGMPFSLSYTLDTLAPTVAISSNAASLKAGDTASITFTFSEAPVGFTQADLSVSGGTLSALAVTANPLVYTALFTPTVGVNSASAAVTLASGLYTDAAGNSGAAGVASAIAIDTLAPTTGGAGVRFSNDSGASATDLITNVAAQTISGTLSANLAAGERVEVSLDKGVSWVAAITTAGSGNWLLTGQTLGSAGVVQVRVSDAAGNHGNPFAASYTLDTQAPGLAITSNLASLNSAETAVISFTFSEVPSGFTQADVAVSGGVLSGFAASADPLVYTALFTPAPGVANGTASVTVAGTGFTDAAGNFGTSAAMAPLSYSTVAPGVAISSNLASLKSGDTALISFRFSAAPTGFTIGDVAASGGTLSGFTASANPLVYTALFTPAAGVAGGVAAITVAAGSYLDGSGNSGAGASMPAVAIDTLAPTLTISSNAASLSGSQTALISFTFSEAPAGFTLDHVTASGGTLSALAPSANPLVYTAVFTPATGVDGAAVITVAPGAYTDKAGNSGGGGAPPTVSIDTLGPLNTATSARFSADSGVSTTDLITNVAAQTIIGTLSANLLSGERVEVSLDNGAHWLNAVTTVGSGNWSLAGQTLASGDNTLLVRVADASGNHGSAFASPYALDTLAPTLTISSSAGVLRAGATAVISFTFSEAPSGFTQADVTVGGGALSGFAATANPLVYTAVFTPVASNTSGSASVTVAGGLYTDVAGNAGAAGFTPSLIIDTARATGVTTARFSADNGSSASDFITNVGAQTISGTLSANLVAGERVEVSVDNGVNWITASATAGSNAWSLAHTLSGQGRLLAHVVEASGQAGPAFSAAYRIDATAPAIAITSASGATLGVGQSAVIGFTLSEAGALTLADIAVSGGVLSNLSGAGTSYSAIFTPAANSTAPGSIGVAANGFTDVAGNGNTAAATLNLAINTTVPGTDPGTNPGTDPGTDPGAGPVVPSTVDGVLLTTQAWTDQNTGVRMTTIIVPVVQASRTEDGSTPHPTLADIPLGIGANSAGVQADLVVSLPNGVGLEASGATTLLTMAQSTLDLIGRIEDETAAGSASRSAMQTQARAFLGSMDPTMLFESMTLVLTAPAGAPGQPILINGASLPGDTSTAAIELVIDASALPTGTVLQLDDIDFAAVIGSVTVHGGAGRNYLIGDAAAQHIVLTTGADNDTVYGNGGDDILGSAAGNDRLDGGSGNDIAFGGAGRDSLAGGAGNDVLQGGRSDVGQWQFYLNDAGQIVGRHQMALTDAAVTETVGAAEINHSVDELGFAAGAAPQLQALSLLYHAAFERAPDLAGLSDWVRSGLRTEQSALGFLQSSEARASLASLGDAQFVETLYQNAFGRAAEPQGLANWLALLGAAPSQLEGRAAVLAGIALSDEHKAAWHGTDGMRLGGQMVTQEQGWIGGSGDDWLDGGAGNDVLVGGDGFDTIAYDGASASYSLSLARSGQVQLVDAGGGIDQIRQIEQGAFGATMVDLGFTQASAAALQQLGMLYHLVLGRGGDIHGFQSWIASGRDIHGLAAGFVDSIESQGAAGALDDAAFISLLYQNTLQQAPDTATLQNWETYLGDHGRADLVATLATDATLVGSQFGPDGMVLVAAMA